MFVTVEKATALRHGQHDVSCMCLCVMGVRGCESKSNRFHFELIHSEAKERSPALAPGLLVLDSTGASQLSCLIRCLYILGPLVPSSGNGSDL